MGEVLSGLIVDTLAEISSTDTYVNKEDCKDFLKDEGREFLEDKEQVFLSLEDNPNLKSKTVLVTEEGAKSVKVYNFDFRGFLKLLPSAVTDLLSLVTSDNIFSRLISTLYLVKRAWKFVGLFIVELDKQHELVFVTIACLSRGKNLIDFDSIGSLLTEQRNNNSNFPRIDTDELKSILNNLKEMKCIEQDKQGGFRSVETLVIKK